MGAILPLRRQPVDHQSHLDYNQNHDRQLDSQQTQQIPAFQQRQQFLQQPFRLLPHIPPTQYVCLPFPYASLLGTSSALCTTISSKLSQTLYYNDVPLEFDVL